MSLVLFAAAAALSVILAVTAGVVLSSKKTASDKEGEKNMVKSLFQYLVLFATLMMTIGGSVSVFMAVADIVSPSPYYQSFENYKEMTRNIAKDPNAQDDAAQADRLSDEELRIRYDAIVEEERRNEQARAVNRLIKSLGWIVIPLPVFLYYQRRLKHSA